MAVITAATSGDFATGATWTGGVAPGTSDTFVVPTLITVTVSTAVDVAGWTIQAAGKVIITGTGTLNSTGNTIINGSSATGWRIEMAAGAKLTWDATAGAITHQFATAASIYAGIKADGTEANPCRIGKKVGSTGNLLWGLGPSGIWLRGWLEAHWTTFDITPASGNAVNISTRYQGAMRLYHCTIDGFGPWTVSASDGNANGGEIRLEDCTVNNLSNSALNLSTGQGATSITLLRNLVPGGVIIATTGTPGTLTMIHNTFRGKFSMPSWAAANVVSNTNFFRFVGPGNAGCYALRGLHEDCYFYYRRKPGEEGQGNPHFQATSTTTTTLRRCIFEYRGDHVTDTGDIVDASVSAVSELENCIVLPCSNPGAEAGRSSGAFWCLGSNSTLRMRFRHCTIHSPGNAGVRFPHSVAMVAGGIDEVKSNIFWSANGGVNDVAFYNDAPASSATDALVPAGVTKNAFVGLATPANNTVGAVTTTALNGFYACEFSVAPTGNLTFPNGTDVFTDPGRNVLAWARSRGYTGTDDEAIDAADAAILADPALIASSLIPFVFEGYQVTEPTLVDAGHDGVTIGAAPAAPPPVTAYTLTLAGASSGPVGTPTGVITVTLGDGVVADPITFTLTATGAAGTFSGPATFDLDEDTRSTTRTFTPSAAGLITFAVTDDGGLTDPLAVTYTAESAEEELVDLDPARLAYWESTIIQRHDTGTKPYLPGPGYNANANEHYDVIQCMMNARDYNIRKGRTPIDWSIGIAAGIDRFRDQFVLGDALGSQLQGQVSYTTGLAHHWQENDDPRDVQAIDQIRPVFMPGYGDASIPAKRAGYEARNANPYYFREISYRVKSYLDRRRVGLPKSPYQDVDMELVLRFMDHYLSPPELRYGVNFKPFFLGMSLRAIIDYWNYFSLEATPDAAEMTLMAQVPAKVRAICDLIWDEAWYPAGELPDGMAGGSYPTWDKGCVPMAAYHRDHPRLATLTGFTVASVVNTKTWIGAGPLSSVDNFYKYMNPGSDTQGAGPGRWVESYDGTTKQFYATGNDPQQNPVVGQTFYLQVQERADGDQPSPPLNLLIAHAYSWYYWYARVVQDDAATGLIYKSRHDQMFNGSLSAWYQPFSQKEWNQGIISTPTGLLWREYGDTDVDYRSLTVEEPPPVATYTLTGPLTGDVGAASEVFTITLDDEPVTGSITFTFHVAGTAGSFSPATRVLNNTTRSGTFQFIPGSAGTATITATNTGGRLDPSGINYVATVPGTTGLVEGYTWANLGATGGAVGSPTGLLRVQYGPGNVPVYIRFTFHVSGVEGTFTNEDRTLNNTFRWGETQFIPSSAGTATLTVTNDGGLPNPPAITYTATGEAVPVAAYTLTLSGAPAGLVGVPTGALTVALGEGTVAAPIAFAIEATGAAGTFSEAPALGLDGAIRSDSLTFTPSAAGLVTFSATNTGGLPDPAPVTYTAEAGPSSGTGTHVLMYTLASGNILLIPRASEAP